MYSSTICLDQQKTDLGTAVAASGRLPNRRGESKDQGVSSVEMDAS